MAREAHAAVVTNSAVAPNVKRVFEQDMNMKTVRLVDFTGDANVNRPPDYYLYLYNIAPRAFEIRRPPNFPLIRLSACPKGQKYAKVATIPSIVNEKWIDADSGEVRVRGIMGERFVMDLVNPSNLGINMWVEITDDQMTWIDGGTDDLTRRGLFFSKNDPPTDDELSVTKQRLEQHYRQLLVRADELSRDPKTRREIGMEHHLAAEYFHARTEWHTVAELPEVCENCGEVVKPGCAYHLNSVGIVCVRDWKRTVESGVKARADVPEDKRWWEQKTGTEARN